MPNQTAKDLLELLKFRHAKDVLVENCKTGASMVPGFRQMDAWVCRSSYTRPAFIAYEIKVSRADFLRDTKWRDYLDYCTEFYFVCPRGLIAPAELPAEAGLLWASSTGSRLFSKKRAPVRGVDPPVDLFMYILMTRCKITRERYRQDTVQYWKGWLARRAEDQNIGHLVSKRIREIDAKRETEVHLLRKQNESYEVVKTLLEELGVSAYGWNIRERLQNRFKGLHPEVERKLESIQTLASQALGLVRNGDE